MGLLAEIVEREGLTVPVLPAGSKTHPALAESRQLRIALARVLAALRLPSGDEDAGRPQRRVGVRSIYSVGGQAPRSRRSA